MKGFNIRESERPLDPEDIWEGPVNIDLSFAARPEEPAVAGKSLEGGIDPALKPEDEPAVAGNAPEEETDPNIKGENEPDIKEKDKTIVDSPEKDTKAPVR